MWQLDHKESWVLKNWCFWTVVLKKTLESPLVSKEIKPVNPQGDQSWIFIGRTDAEAEAPVLWPPDVKRRLIGKDPDSGKDWRQEEKGMREDEMVGWHHWLNGHEFEQALGVGDGKESLACCSPWDCKELDATEWLNWNWMYYFILCITSFNTSCKVWTSTIPFYRWGNRGLSRWGDLHTVMQVIAKAGTDGNCLWFSFSAAGSLCFPPRIYSKGPVQWIGSILSVLESHRRLGRKALCIKESCFMVF